MDRAQKPWILRVVVSVALLALVGSTCAARAMAEERGAHAREHWRGGEVEHWGHGDIRRFHEGDLERWRGGSWFHGEHFGRLGWWWIVDGAWYFYPAAVYPYPDPYVPPTVVTPAPAQPSPQYWYYCASAKAYYPYVPTCSEGWQQVVPAARSQLEAAPASRLNVQRVRLAGGLRAPPRSWTLLLALAAFVRRAPRRDRGLAEEPAIHLGGGEKGVHSVTNIPTVAAVMMAAVAHPSHRRSGGLTRFPMTV